MTQEQKSTKKPDQAEQTSPAHEILSLLLYIVIVFGICFLIITFVGQRSRVSGSSMEPTLSDGDNLIVDKISYRLHDPERFDIIIFPYQYEENTNYIKRIIGLPGETVYIERKKKRWEGNAQHHICRDGETAYSIGQSYGIRTRSIEKLNRLKRGEKLEKNRQIRIK